jgi:hypothetical protein
VYRNGFDRECQTGAEVSDDSAPTRRERRGPFFEGVIRQLTHVSPIEPHDEDIPCALPPAFADRQLVLETAAGAGECDPLTVV